MATIGVIGDVNEAMASARFRILIPSRHSKHTYRQGIGDITLLFKFGVDPGKAKEMRSSTPLVFDITDDHFGKERDYYFRSLCDIAHYITCTTETLRERILEETGRDALVISDPLEFPQRPPKIGSEKLLWYGHHSNLEPVLGLEIPGRRLKIITNAKGYIPWSLLAMQEGLDWCDAVILPIGGIGPRKDTKSPNRMTEAINAGRFVIANDMPAYRGYGMYLGDIFEGLNWLDTHQEQAMESLCKAQKLVWEKHNPQTITQEWDALFDSILGVVENCGTALST